MACKHGVDWLSADFNCTVTDPAYVNAILDRLRDEQPRIYGMILYVEQPFPYELERHRMDVHSVSARKPLFLDESAHDWRLVRLGRELGWSGVALKTCKTQTGALLSACWARAHGMSLMVQDLTNPMLAQIPHVLLAAHTGTIMGVETNAMQFYPEASRPEAAVHPGLYQRRQGRVELSSVRGPGFGYRLREIQRELAGAGSGVFRLKRPGFRPKAAGNGGVDWPGELPSGNPGESPANGTKVAASTARIQQEYYAMNGPLRILHLEDDPDYCDLVQLYADQEGLQVEMVPGGRPRGASKRLWRRRSSMSSWRTTCCRPTTAWRPCARRARNAPKRRFCWSPARSGSRRPSRVLRPGRPIMCSSTGRNGWCRPCAARSRRPRSGSSGGESRPNWFGGRRHFRALTENALDILTILDREGAFIHNSPSIKRVLGYEPEDLAGQSAFAFIHPEDLPRRLGRRSTTA